MVDGMLFMFVCVLIMFSGVLLYVIYIDLFVWVEVMKFCVFVDMMG